MSKFLLYRCSLCGSEFDASEEIYVCPHDQGNLDIVYDYSTLRKTVTIESIVTSDMNSLWRYLPLLPVTEPPVRNSSINHAGRTPIYYSNRLGAKIGLNNLWVKDESPNPTASFKDRASAVVVARAKEIQAKVIITASTGNAGAALAGMAASADQRAIIFAPKNAPRAKIAQLLMYDAEVILINGTYDDAFDLSLEASQEFGWYCRNTGYNPFTAEGKKTAAFEIWEWALHQPILKQIDEPLSIFISVGDGNIISGIHKGLKDLVALGWISELPRLYGVQAHGSAAIANTFQKESEIIEPVSADTLADSISVDYPRDGVRALRAARETGGAYITVSDKEILDAMVSLGSIGIFAEPAGATSLAGAISALKEGTIDAYTPVLILNTGSGLKDVNAALDAVPYAPIIEPSLEKLRSLIS